MNNFHTSLTNELFDNEESDFGGPAIKIEHRLDSVVLLPDSTFIMVTSIRDFGHSFNSFPEQPLKISVKRDTVRNSDYIFSGRHTFAGITAAIGKNYYRWGEVTDSTKFIGFKKKSKEKKEDCKEIDPTKLGSPFIINDPPDNNSPFGPSFIFMLATILLLSLAGGWLTWRLYKPKLQPA